MGLRLFATYNGVPVGDGGPMQAIGGDIVLTELGQFSGSSVVLPASNRRALLAMREYTLIEVEQEGVGVLCYGYVLNPRQQITQNDSHTITLELAPLTTECTWRKTRRGWTATNALSVVAQRLGALTPGWRGVFTDAGTVDSTGKPRDITVGVTLNATALGGFLDTAKQFAQFARQGLSLGTVTRVNVNSPGIGYTSPPLVSFYGAGQGATGTAVLTGGLLAAVTVTNGGFGYTAPPTVTITGGGGNGGSGTTAIDGAVGTPGRVLEMGQFGATPTTWLVSANGGDPAKLVGNDLIRLVATIDREPNNVSNLVNVCVPFGGGSSNDTLVTLERLWRIVNDPTYPNYGKYGNVPGSVFPEFDANYPISDPLNPSGAGPWTRGQTLDGQYDYIVFDAASYAQYGHREGDFTDSSLTYADNSPANQELTARALYVSAIANFKRYSHPHHTFTCTAEGRGRPTRAGDLIAVDYQRLSTDDTGTVAEMNVTSNLRVMRVSRAFQGEAPPLDTYTLSNLGRFDDTDGTAGANTARQMVALQINRGTGLAKDTVIAAGNLDALNPLTVWHYIVPEHFRYHSVRVRCDFYPYRATSQTATNSDATINISIPQRQISIPAQSITINVSDHTHTISLATTDSGGPGALRVDPKLQINPGKGNGHALYQSGGGAWLEADGGGYQAVSIPATVIPSSQFVHNHTISGASGTGGGGRFSQTGTGSSTTIPGVNVNSPLPQHTHALDQRIPQGPSPVAIRMDINGQSLSSGASSSGTRDPGKSFAFTGSFVVNDIGVYLDAFPPGTDVPLTFNAYTDPTSNLYGTGFLAITITSVEELGGLTSTARVQ